MIPTALIPVVTSWLVHAPSSSSLLGAIFALPIGNHALFRTRAVQYRHTREYKVNILYFAGTGKIVIITCVYLLFCRLFVLAFDDVFIVSVPLRAVPPLKFGVGLRPARILPLAHLPPSPGLHMGAAQSTPCVTDVTHVMCATPGRRRFGKGLTLGWQNASSDQRGMLPIGLEKPRHAEKASVLLDLVNLRVHHQIAAELALIAQLQPHLRSAPHLRSLPQSRVVPQLRAVPQSRAAPWMRSHYHLPHLRAVR